MKSALNIPVLIADAQFLTRKALADLIEKLPGFELVAQFEALEQLLPKMSGFNKSLVILSLLNTKEGFMNELSAFLKSSNNYFLVVSDFADAKDIQALIEMGVKGIVTKKCSEEEIITAIKSVALGKRFYCNNVLNKLVEKDETSAGNAQYAALSKRELEVLKLIAQGNTTEKIAEKLYISIHTVNSHRKNMLKKLNITSPVHLVAYAVENGLVSIDYKAGG